MPEISFSRGLFLLLEVAFGSSIDSFLCFFSLSISRRMKEEEKIRCPLARRLME